MTKFLMGLNESYEQSSRYILMLKPIPTIEEAFNIVTQDERQRALRPSTKIDNVAFQTSTAHVSAGLLPSPLDESSYAAAYNTSRQAQRPVCTHCGKSGHTIHKCFKLHGFPPGYKTGSHSYYKNQSKPASYNAQPMNQKEVSQTNAIANVHSSLALPQQSSPAPIVPHLTTGGTSITPQDFTPQQIQHLISQFNSQVRAPEHFTPSSRASITEHGIMASTSSSGIIPFPSTSLKFQHHILTFQDHCLSSLQNFLSRDAWIIDSGASSHVCSDLAMFTKLAPVSSVNVSLPNGINVPITHTGTISFSDSLILSNVLNVPDFRFNMISVSCLVGSLSCAAHFYPNGCFIQELSRGLMIGRGELHHNLYILAKPTLSTSTHIVPFCGSVLPDDRLWHTRLGHPSSAILQRLISRIPTMKPSDPAKSSCQICPLAKQRRLAYVSNNSLSLHPYDLVHLDVWGPFHTEYAESYRYFFSLVDDCTRMTWVYMMKNKNDVLTIFSSFLTLVSTQYHSKVKSIRSDNAPELAFPSLIKEHGIVHYFSCPYTPQQNFVVERKHQHLLNVARALLF